MKRIGLLGGMSWQSTVEYYRLINERVGERLGGHHSADLVLYSVDFAPVEQCQAAGDWERAGEFLAEAARRVEAAGADFLVLATNTMHRVADRIEVDVSLPLLHIVDVTAREITASGASVVGLLGTRFTMEDDFYRKRLEVEHDIEVLVPPPSSRALIHDVIYRELCAGFFEAASRRAFVSIVTELAAAGAEGVVLGCTEIGLLLGPDDVDVPLFDSAALHARAAADLALDG